MTASDFAVLAALPVAMVFGAAVSRLSSTYGATKVLWVWFAFVAAIVAARSVQIALAVLLLALAFPFRTKLFLGYDIHTTLAVLGIVCVQLIAGLALRTLRLPAGIGVPATLLVAGGALGALAGPAPGRSLLLLAAAVVPSLLVALAVASGIRPGRDLLPMALALGLALAGGSVIAILQVSGHAPALIAPFEKDRVNGLFEHPNVLGGYLTASILVLVGVNCFAWRRSRFAGLLVVPVLVGVGGLASTQSRGALLGLVVGVAVVMIVMAIRQRFVPLLALLLMVALVLLVAIPQIPESERTAFAERALALQRPNTESERQTIWDIALQTIQSHPVLGVGPEGFREIARHDPAARSLAGGLMFSHNLVLEGLMSLGVIGFAGFVALWVRSTRGLLRACRQSAVPRDPMVDGWAIGTLGAFSSLLVQGMVDFLFWQLEFMVLLFFLLGMGFALDRSARDPASPGRFASRHDAEDRLS